jgi:heme/copper-type cytochrome/quinol oxidase subunit 4
MFDASSLGSVLQIGLVLLGGAVIIGAILGLLFKLRRAPGGQDADTPVAAEEEPAAAVEAELLEARRKERSAAYRRGFLVFVGLAALTALEFWVATAAGGSVAFLFLIALVKAGVIVQYYMHLESVWSEEGAHS